MDERVPHRRDHTGREPADARSALRLRFVLAVGGALLCATAAMAVALVADENGAALLWTLGFAALAAVGTVDAAVVARRLRRRDLG